MVILKFAIAVILLSFVSADETKNCTYTPCKLESCGIMNQTQTCRQFCGKTDCAATCLEPIASCRQECPVGGCKAFDCKSRMCLQICDKNGSCPLECVADSCRQQCTHNCKMHCEAKECIDVCQSGCNMNCNSEACTLDCSGGGCTMQSSSRAKISELYCPKGDCHLKCHENTPKEKCQCKNCTTITYYSTSSHHYSNGVIVMILFSLLYSMVLY